MEFIYDLQGLAGVVYNSGSIAKTYFYRKDAQGNIVALLDENGAVVVKYVYNAWGEHKVLNPDGTENTSASFIGNVNPFRYRGYYYDKALKFYYLVTRYYDPVVGRFISQDSFDYADPDTINGLNLYAYCGNNPVMMVDSDGHAPKWWQSILIGLGVIVGAALVATAIAFTGGGAAAFLGMWGTAIVGGLKVAAAAGVTAGVIRTGMSVASSIQNGAGVGDAFIDAGKSFVLGFSDGFLAGSIYAGSTMILSAGAFRIAGLFNNGYGWAAGKFIGGYQTPKTPGISILTHLGGINGGRSFGLDLDMFNGLHFHTNKFGSKIKTHHWMLAPILLGIYVGFNPYSEW